MSRPVPVLGHLVSLARRRTPSLRDPRPLGALPRLCGPALASQCLRQAASALIDAGRTPAETFHALRLELNRLEQGGLRAPDPAAPEPMAAEGSGQHPREPKALPQWIDEGMPGLGSRAARRARRVVGQRLQRAVDSASAWIR